MELLDEETLKKIRLAYVLGSLRRMYEEDGVSGDMAMFVIPLEEHVEMVNDPPELDPYNLGKVTAEDIISILKNVYAEDYEDMVKDGFELRKKENELKVEEEEDCMCEECKMKKELQKVANKHETMTKVYIV